MLRAGLHAAHRLFLWDRADETRVRADETRDRPYGLAYELTKLELCERAFRLPGARRSLRCPDPPLGGLAAGGLDSLAAEALSEISISEMRGAPAGE